MVGRGFFGNGGTTRGVGFSARDNFTPHQAPFVCCKPELSPSVNWGFEIGKNSAKQGPTPVRTVESQGYFLIWLI